MPIVLGGPWKRDGRTWELWQDGEHRQDATVPFTYNDKRMMWHGTIPTAFTAHDDPARTEFRAPRDWIPTPDTIPEGCYIKTPEGAERCCATCAGYGTSIKHKCYRRHQNGEMNYANWCPKPAEEKPAQEVHEGQWVWRDGGMTQREDWGTAAKIVEVLSEYLVDIGDDAAWHVDNLRPVKVGDKVKVVDESKTPHTTCVTGRTGTIDAVGLDYNDKDAVHADFGSSVRLLWHEDIRLAE